MRLIDYTSVCDTYYPWIIGWELSQACSAALKTVRQRYAPVLCCLSDGARSPARPD